MYRLTNVPHRDDEKRGVQLEAVVDGQTVKVVSTVAKKWDDQTPRNTIGVCDMFIGDHMFEPDKRDDLRMMVGRALITAIEHARNTGYRQAQADIRRALGAD